MAPTGTAVLVGGEEDGNVTGGFGRILRAPLVSMFVRQRLAMLASKEHDSFFERLTPLIEAAGHVRGKVAITIPTEEGSS